MLEHEILASISIPFRHEGVRERLSFCDIRVTVVSLCHNDTELVISLFDWYYAVLSNLLPLNRGGLTWEGSLSVG